MDIHRIPPGELELHEVSRDCKCNPTIVNRNDQTIVTHTKLVKDVEIKVKN